ncbi:MAG TPA: indole-3-glycerol phosphate synthase TrpC [Phycisphaerae bacterium]|nr:indole-3-glycerol phosphate synthase TrpC [Phycisphaerae bacterium]
MSLPDILQQIVETKKQELAAAQSRMPVSELRARVKDMPAPRNFFAALTKEPEGLVNIIAEVKKASPSAGAFKSDAEFDPVAVAKAYDAAGADALSILTDEKYFGGKLEYIAAVKAAVPLPVLRKDFIIDPYQVVEARAAGADAILLIAEILTDSLMIDLQILAAELKLTCLIEVHEMDSLLRVRSTIGIPMRSYCLLGINNRDLRTFKTDLSTTIRLAEFVEDKQILVAESGIRDKADVQRMTVAGVRTLLVGETLMRSGDIGGTMANLKGIFRRA